MAFRSIPLHLRVDATKRARQLSLFQRSNRAFAPYQQWEDYRAGMFSGRQSDSGMDASVQLLSRVERCRPAMLRVVREWPVATAVNLTNPALNQKAWLGQAACCLSVGSSADETKRAWWSLTEAERLRANACAYEVIAEWQNGRA
jgi:hypothetical protein